MPLRMAAYSGRTAWNSDLQGLGDQIADAASLALELQNGSRKVLKLHEWSDWTPEKDADLADPLNTFLIVPNPTERKDDEKEKKPALVIIPGGEYEFVSFQNEGVPIQNLEKRKVMCHFLSVTELLRRLIRLPSWICLIPFAIFASMQMNGILILRKLLPADFQQAGILLPAPARLLRSCCRRENRMRLFLAIR